VSARDPLLRVDDLRVQFWTERGTIHAVNGISFDIAPGETLGIVGESGCGKSVTSLALLGILPRAGRIAGGHAWFGGRDLLALEDDELAVRGALEELAGDGEPDDAGADDGDVRVRRHAHRV
jgi:ABC-type glutathione transport system ATPase component